VIFKALNFVSFQAGWFACVFGAAAGQPWLGPAALVVLLGLHFAWPRPRRAEIALLVFAAVFGYAMDSLLVLAGVIEFPPAARLGWPSPVWMVALWVNLATTLNASLSWLRGRYVTAALVGALAGPLSYFAGARLEAIGFGLPAGLSLAAIAAEWAVSTPMLVAVAALTKRCEAKRDGAKATRLCPAEVHP
jgi:hypothetical protein